MSTSDIDAKASMNIVCLDFFLNQKRLQRESLLTRRLSDFMM
jgi:hypothetical protein